MTNYIVKTFIMYKAYFTFAFYYLVILLFTIIMI